MTEREKAERAGATSGVVTRATAAKTTLEQPYVKQIPVVSKTPKKPRGPEPKPEASPVVARLSPLTLPTTSQLVIVLSSFSSSSSGAVGTQDEPLSISSSSSSERHYFDSFGRFHSDVEPDSDIDESVRQPQPSTTEWFRPKRILSYRRRKGYDF